MTENIIGRKKELELLDKYYNSGKAEFIALYGRRRVGKTFLIRQKFRNNFTFDMTGVMEGTKAEQITASFIIDKAKNHSFQLFQW